MGDWVAFSNNELANFITRAFDKKGVLATHTEKAEQLFHSIGCQSSKENTTISFDDSIAYTTANIKYPGQENNIEKSDVLIFYMQWCHTFTCGGLLYIISTYAYCDIVNVIMLLTHIYKILKFLYLI